VLLQHNESRREVAGGRIGSPPRKLSWLLTTAVGQVKLQFVGGDLGRGGP
jgi:hypothetical protein